MSDSDVSFVAYVACVAAILLFQYVVSAQSRSDTRQHGARRGDLHLQRKLQHCGTGAMIYGASRFFGAVIGSGVLLGFAMLFYGLHELRGRSKAVNDAYVSCFRSILRQYEVSRAALPGAYYFLLGSGISLMVFPMRVARLAILHLSVGDPAAALFGTLFGQHKLRKLIGPLSGNKSLEGSTGCFIVVAASTFAMLMLERDFYFDGSEEASAATAISLAAGIGAAVAELLDIGGWDDNLTLPLLSGVFLQLSVGRLL